MNPEFIELMEGRGFTLRGIAGDEAEAFLSKWQQGTAWLLQDAGLVTPAELNVALAATINMPVVDTAALQPEPETLSALPESFARRQRSLPLLRGPGPCTAGAERASRPGRVPVLGASVP